MATKTAKPKQTLDEVRANLSKLRSRITTFVSGQEDMVDSMFLAALTRQHVCFIGPPGVSKSLTIDIFAHGLGAGERNQAMLKASENGGSDLNGAAELPFTFYTTLDKYASPESLLGPIDPRKLKSEGKWVRNTENSIADATYAYLDEGFSANGATLRALVRILNERQIEQGGIRMKVPLRSCFLATNTQPQEHVAAVYDRFLFRVHANYLDVNDLNAFLKMMKSPRWDADEHEPLLSPDQMVEAESAVSRVHVSQAIHSDMFDLRSTLAVDKIILTDRRWVWAEQALKASAWLRGDEAVNNADYYTALRYILWNTPEQIELTAQVLEPYRQREASSKSEEDALRDAQNIYDQAMASENPSDKIQALVSLQNLGEDHVTSEPGKAKIKKWQAALQQGVKK